MKMGQKDEGGDANAKKKGRSNNGWHVVIFIYLLLVTIGLLGTLFSIWPDVTPDEMQLTEFPDAPWVVIADSTVFRGRVEPVDSLGTMSDTVRFTGEFVPAREISPNETLLAPSPIQVSDREILLLVMIAGALGACLHGLTSLGEFVGSRSFCATWTIWYILRPFVGAILAVLFYFVLRGGMLNPTQKTGDFYGTIALAGLVGLFSKQALYKLSDIFNVIFKSPRERKLSGKIQRRGKPAIEQVAPESLKVGATDVDVTVTGKGFYEDSKVLINGKEMETTFVSETLLTAKMTGIDLSKPRKLKITVLNPCADGGTSAEKEIPVE
jgi:hypothetical protein